MTVGTDDTFHEPDQSHLIAAPAASTPNPPGRRRFRISLPNAVPTRTLPLLGLLFALGLLALAFTYLTVHRRTAVDMAPNSGVIRTNFSVNHWVEHGYFRSCGLLVRPWPTEPGFHFYLSSTGGHLVSAFVVEKVYKALTGHTSIRLLALHNQMVTLVAAALFGLLAIRLARRIGAPPLHALTLGAAVEVVHFTFPDNLAMFWELSGRQPFLVFAAIFLLIEDRGIERRTPGTTIAQGVAAFLMTYMEYNAGTAFLGSWLVVTTLLERDRIAIRRLLGITVLPALLALGIYATQRASVRLRYPDTPVSGSNFAFRTGLDGSAQYYGDHLDIAFGRANARANFAQNREYLFRWTWLFWAGTAALLSVLLQGVRGRVPLFVMAALMALLGSYLLYAALFSQAFVIHPYYFDVLLFTPLVLALLAVAPAVFESMTMHRGVFVVAVFFVAAWLCMVQLRAYALRYPPPQYPAADITKK